MFKERILITGGILLLAVLGLVWYTGIQSANATNPLQGQSLVGATPEELAIYAMRITQATHIVLSGTPQVRLARRVTNAEFPSLGIEPLNLDCGEPPMALVILKGDFVSDMGSLLLNPARRVTYIGYIFDLRNGGAISIMYSPNGGAFRIALDDPSLPADVAPVNASTAVSRPTLMPAPTLVSAPRETDCGKVRSTVAPPTNKQIIPTAVPMSPQPLQTLQPYPPPPSSAPLSVPTTRPYPPP